MEICREGGREGEGGRIEGGTEEVRLSYIEVLASKLWICTELLLYKHVQQNYIVIHFSFDVIFLTRKCVYLTLSLFCK